MINNIDDARGMYLAKSIYTTAGSLAVMRGTKLDDKTISYLKKLGFQSVVVSKDPVKCELGLMGGPVEDNGFMHRDELYNLLKISFARYSSTGQRTRELDQIISRLINDLRYKKHLLNCILDVKCIDPYTYLHSINVMVISLLIGRFMELSSDDLYSLAIGSLFHDIGKIKIPPEILLSKKVISKAEKWIIERHSIDGYDILSRIPDIPEKTSLIAMEHHERIDGSGYPNKLKFSDIDILSQIVGVADTLEAMSCDRDYRKCHNNLEITEYLLANSGVLFDNDIIRALLKGIAFYRIGSIVQLNNKQCGMVIKSNPDFPNRPVVRILFNHNRIKPLKKSLIDLSNPDNNTIFISKVFY